MKLYYDKPAGDWVEALPIGNGRLGGMVFGSPTQERIALNEGTLYSGEPLPVGVVDIKSTLDQVVAWLKAEDYERAHAYITQNWLGRCQQCYQPLGDLTIDTGKGDVEDYRRELDLSTAVCTTRYARNGVHTVREVFASHPSDVMVVRVTTSAPQSFAVSLSSPHPVVGACPDDRTVSVKGQVPGMVLRRDLEVVEAAGHTEKYPEIWDAEEKRHP